MSPARSGHALTVAVVGAQAPLGAAIVDALRRADCVQRVVAVHDTGDLVAGKAGSRQAASRKAELSSAGPSDPVSEHALAQYALAPHPVEIRSVDAAGPAVAGPLAGVDAVVHVAADVDLAAAADTDAARRRDRARSLSQAVTTACAAVGAEHLVVVSSATVLGPSTDERPRPDDAPREAVPDDGLVGDLLVVEDLLDRARTAHPGVKVAVLRPASLVGAGVDTPVTRHFAAPRLLTLRERAPRWQFCAVADLAGAVVTVLERGLQGPLGVGSDGSLDQDDVERVTGMRRVELSARQARVTAERLARRGVLLTPATDLAYVTHPPLVDAQGLRQAGWSPAQTNEECLADLVDLVSAHRSTPAGDGRRGSGSGSSGLGVPGIATAGAAGAAVALVATAALVRQARARRRS